MNIRIYNPANEIAKLESQKKFSKFFAVSKIIRIFAVVVCHDIPLRRICIATPHSQRENPTVVNIKIYNPANEIKTKKLKNMNKRLLSLLILVLAIMLPVNLWAQGPYTVLTMSQGLPVT